MRGVKSLNQSLAKQFAGNDVDFKWDKHDNNKVKRMLGWKTTMKIEDWIKIYKEKMGL